MRWKQGLKCTSGAGEGYGERGDEIEPSALRQCIIWRFHLLASIRGGCDAIKGVSEVCVPVCPCECARTCVFGEPEEWSSVLLNRMGLPVL